MKEASLSYQVQQQPVLPNFEMVILLYFILFLLNFFFI